ERDDVVLDLGLDGRDPLRVDTGTAPNRRDRLLRHLAAFGHCLARQDLDLEPARVACGIGPDRPHRGPRVSTDHASNPPNTARSTPPPRTSPSITRAHASGTNSRPASATI